MKLRFSFLSLLLLLLILSGCQPAQPAGLSSAQVAALTANVLQSLDRSDYAGFSRDFSDSMKAAFTQDQFTHLHDMLQEASGNYLSQGASSLSNNQNYALYHIVCKYEKEEVAVTLSFQVGGTQIEGLWFDSLNLRKLNK